MEKLKVGTIRFGREIGKTVGSSAHSRFILHACLDCGKERWVYLVRGKPVSLRCYSCRGKLQRGSNCSSWRGGRSIEEDGYVLLLLPQDDPFFCMANQSRQVYEHRYVIAKKLGRPLESWEIVHHKGTRYPMDSREDRQDNREENLELVSHLENIQIKLMSTRISQLEDQVASQQKLLIKIVALLVSQEGIVKHESDD